MALIARATAVLGAALVVTGIALIYVPAALIVGGLWLTAVGVFGVDVK